MKLVVQLSLSCLACLSANHYYIYIINENKCKNRISSEQTLVFMDKIRINDKNCIFIADSLQQWAIYNIQPQLILLFSGILPQKRIINLELIDNYWTLLFTSGQLYYIKLYGAGQIQNINSYCTKPSYEYYNYLAYKFMPDKNHNKIICSCIVCYPNYNALYLAYRQINNQLYSIYQVFIEHHQVLSGKYILFNLQYQVLSMHNIQKHVLIQTKQSLYHWNTTNNKIKMYDEWSFKHPISQIYQQNKYYAVFYSNLQSKGLKIQLNKKQQLIFNQMKLPTQISILELYKGNNDTFALTDKLQIILLSNTTQLLTNNHISTIIQAQLETHDNYSLLLLMKQIGYHKEQIIVTNQYIIKNITHYEHQIKMYKCSLINYKINCKAISIIINSVLLGLLSINIKIRNNFTLQIQLEQQMIQEQILFQNQKYSISSNNILIKNKKYNILEMFDHNIQFIDHAIIIGDYIILTSVQQLHIFNANFIRTHIHCFDSEIKCLLPFNTVNVIGVWLFGHKQLEQSIIGCSIAQKCIEQRKKIILYDTGCEGFMSYDLVINTVTYRCNFINGWIILCSNQNIHKYQTDRIKIDLFKMPLPLNQPNFTIQIFNLFKSQQSKYHSYVLLYHDKIQYQSQLYIGHIAKNNIIENLDQFSIKYEYIIGCNKLPINNRILFGVMSNQQQQQHLILFGQHYFHVIQISTGIISDQQIRNKPYLLKYISTIKDQYAIKQFINANMTNISEKQTLMCLRTALRHRYLVYNEAQLWYTWIFQKNVKLLSYFTKVNDYFMNFRNILSLDEVTDEDFLNIFQRKKIIKQVKYIDHSAIVVLYQDIIMILQLKTSDTFIVRQQIAMQWDENNEHFTTKIIQLLQQYNNNSIYMVDNQNRLLILFCDSKNHYSIQFDSHLDDDIMIKANVYQWNNPHRIYSMKPKQQTVYDSIVLKKDAQLLINSGNNSQAIYL